MCLLFSYIFAILFVTFCYSLHYFKNMEISEVIVKPSKDSHQRAQVLELSPGEGVCCADAGAIRWGRRSMGSPRMSGSEDRIFTEDSSLSPLSCLCFTILGVWDMMTVQPWLYRSDFICVRVGQPHTVLHVRIFKAGTDTSLGHWMPSLDTPRLISPSSFPLLFSVFSLSSFLVPSFVPHPRTLSHTFLPFFIHRKERKGAKVRTATSDEN